MIYFLLSRAREHESNLAGWHYGCVHLGFTSGTLCRYVVVYIVVLSIIGFMFAGRHSITPGRGRPYSTGRVFHCLSGPEDIDRYRRAFRAGDKGEFTSTVQNIIWRPRTSIYRPFTIH